MATEYSRLIFPINSPFLKFVKVKHSPLSLFDGIDYTRNGFASQEPHVMQSELPDGFHSTNVKVLFIFGPAIDQSRFFIKSFLVL